MYEDTVGQCNTKLDIALGYYRAMESSEKSAFTDEHTTSYVIATAKHRLDTWAASKGKTINYSTGELNAANGSIILGSETTNSFAILIITSMISITLLGGYIFIRRRKGE